jgi:membrane protein YdbS with pleckstrin-like domain
MVVADGLAIIVGAVAGKHLPERLIQVTAAALFLLFGAYMLLKNIFPAASSVIVGGSAVAIVLLAVAVLRVMPERLRPTVLRAHKVSEDDDRIPGIAGEDQDLAVDSGRGTSST